MDVIKNEKEDRARAENDEESGRYLTSDIKILKVDTPILHSGYDVIYLGLNYMEMLNKPWNTKEMYMKKL